MRTLILYVVRNGQVEVRTFTDEDQLVRAIRALPKHFQKEKQKPRQTAQWVYSLLFEVRDEHGYICAEFNLKPE